MSTGTGVIAPAAEFDPQPRRFDLLEPAALDDPYPIYDELRAVAPVYRDRRFFGSILTRYDDVVALLKDPRVSARRPAAEERIPRALLPVADELRELRAFQSRWMLYVDPPEHTRLRGLINRSFTAATVAGMRGRVQNLVDELLRPWKDGAPFDLVRDFARPLPALVIADILGLPPEDRSLFQTWSDGIAAGMVLSTRQDAIGGISEAHQAQRELIGYFQQMIALRRLPSA